MTGRVLLEFVSSTDKDDGGNNRQRELLGVQLPMKQHSATNMLRGLQSQARTLPPESSSIILLPSSEEESIDNEDQPHDSTVPTTESSFNVDIRLKPLVSSNKNRVSGWSIVASVLLVILSLVVVVIYYQKYYEQSYKRRVDYFNNLMKKKEVVNN